MNFEKLNAAFRVIDREIERGEIPGAAVAIGHQGRQVTYAAGLAVATPERNIPAAVDTIYDCASLTKVVVTLPLILQLIDQGELRLDDPVAYFLPAFAENDKSDITIKHLLTHTSGLIAHTDLHSHGWTRQQIIEQICRQPKHYETGTKVVYSDLGFILLGEIASALFGLPLDAAASQYIFTPLGMKDSCFCPDGSLQPRIAATEFMPELGGHLWGRVHDENALAMGGISGHAGLFSTAEDLARYARMWLTMGETDSGRVLSQAAMKASTKLYTAHLSSGRRALGWVAKGDGYDASGDWLSERSYGHTGFTGTSLWIDPDHDLYVVLLTNRVHFGRGKSVARLRACFHNAVAASIE